MTLITTKKYLPYTRAGRMLKDLPRVGQMPYTRAERMLKDLSRCPAVNASAEELLIHCLRMTKKSVALCKVASS